jgi:hypothetical protein
VGGVDRRLSYYCLHKLEDEDTSELYPTNVACKLDRRTLAVPTTSIAASMSRLRECSTVAADELEWLPSTCAIACAPMASRCSIGIVTVSGDREASRTHGQSTRTGWT